jgi:hypothetical protein
MWEDLSMNRSGKKLDADSISDNCNKSNIITRQFSAIDLEV